MPLKQWVRQSLYAVGSDTAVAGRSLVASKAAVSRGSREERGFPEQLIFWAELWRDKNLRVGESCGGLGLFATKGLPEGSMVARGVLDGEITWPETGVLAVASDGRHAALFGPISLINSACEEHANARLERVRDTYRACLIRKVNKGDEILLCYSQPGEALHCPHCGVLTASV